MGKLTVSLWSDALENASEYISVVPDAFCNANHNPWLDAVDVPYMDMYPLFGDVHLVSGGKSRTVAVSDGAAILETTLSRAKMVPPTVCPSCTRRVLFVVSIVISPIAPVKELCSVAVPRLI